jgi:hypothetical protein
MPEITPERLAEIEARCKAATKPPWKFSAPGGRDCIWMDVVDENGDEILSGETQPQTTYLSKSRSREAKV